MRRVLFRLTRRWRRRVQPKAPIAVNISDEDRSSMAALVRLLLEDRGPPRLRD
jgi:hypothetical protein